MAGVAGFLGIGIMRKLLDQLRSVGLVDIVAIETIRPDKRLPLVGIDNRLGFQVVTCRTLLARIFLLMVLEFELSRSPGLVGDMTGIAPFIQSGMPTPIFWYIQAGCMTCQAEIIGLGTRKGLPQMILVRRFMRVVAFDAVALRRRMQTTLADNSLPFFMALQTKGYGRGGLQIDADDLPGDPNLMAGKTANADCRMN